MYELLPPTLDCSVTVNQPNPVAVHVALTMTEKVEQHICMQFCQKLGHLCSETYDMIQKTFGHEAMGHIQAKEWFRWFKKGQMSVQSAECSDRPSMSRN
jgi:hypothetical protein